VTVVATICGHNNVFQFNHSMCAGYYKTFLPDPVPINANQNNLLPPIPINFKQEVLNPMVIPVNEEAKEANIEKIKEKH
jgi:hypothetical protein